MVVVDEGDANAPFLWADADGLRDVVEFGVTLIAGMLRSQMNAIA